MITLASLEATVTVLTAVVGGLVAVTAVRKATRVRTERRTARLQRRLRPLLVRLLAEDEPDLSGLAGVTRAAGRELDRLVEGMLPKLRGADRRILVDLLVARGTVAAAVRRTHRPGAVGRARAAVLLGDAGLPDTLPTLLRLLGDRSLDVRLTAARALGKLGDPAAVPALLGATAGRRPLPAGLVAMSVLHVGPGAVDPLRAALDDPREPVRALAVELIGLVGDLAAAGRLLTMLTRDDAVEVRIRAARALGRLGVPAAVKPLGRALAPGSPAPLRAVAARALGLVGTSAAVRPLRSGLTGGHGRLARSCAESLAAIGEPGRAALRRIAAGKASEPARTARAVLAEVALSDARGRQPDARRSA